MEDHSRLSPLKQAFLALEAAQRRVAELEEQRGEAIAVIGVGCRFPGGSDNPQAFWSALAQRKDGVRHDVTERWQSFGGGAPARIPEATRSAGLIDQIDEFDPKFFGIAPREANGIDPQQRLLLEVSWDALEHAGIAPTSVYGSATGVYFGICTNDYAQLQLSSGAGETMDAHFASGIAHSVASGRVSYVLGLQGPSLSVDTACSSSLVAVHLACEGLKRQDCDLALTGGVNLILTPEASLAYAQAGMLARDGRVKAFDAGADGFVRGEGCGVVVLKRVRDAEASGDRILAVIRGSAVNQDGPSSGLTVPNGKAQQALLRRALANAGLQPQDVEYVEAHGTGTSLGDPIEAEALGQVYGAGRSPEEPLWIGSVKTNLGHLEAAAGIAGLIKVVLGLERGEMPAQLHWREPNPLIRWSEWAVRVVTEARPWARRAGQRRRAGVSAFGFSGTNAHVIVEEAPERANVSQEVRPLEILTITGRTARARHELVGQYAAYLSREREANWAAVCQTGNQGRAHWGFRVSVQAASAAEASEKLRRYAHGETVAGVVEGTVPVGAAVRVGLVVPSTELPAQAAAELRAGWRVFAEAEAQGGTAAALVELWKSWGIEARPLESSTVRLTLQVPETSVWAYLAGELQRLDAAGVAVNWAGWQNGIRHERVSLPTYPFERERFWIEAKPIQSLGAKPLNEIETKYETNSPERLGSGAGPRWLGVRLRSALETIQFETDLSAGAGWLEEHHVKGRTVLPGAGLLELFLAAEQELGLGRELRDVLLLEPLEWATGSERPTVQVLLDPVGSELGSGEGRRARILSLAAGAAAGPWRLHAEGWLGASPLGPSEDVAGPALTLAEARQRCAQPVERDSLYAALRARGLEFGPQFQGLQQVWRGSREALGLVQMQPAGDGWLFYPPLLDACLQVAGALAGPETLAGDVLYLPFRLGRFSLAGSPGERVFSHVRVTSSDPAALACDLTLFNLHGSLLARLQHLQFRAVQQPAKLASPIDPRSWFYRIVWEQTPTPQRTTSFSVANLADLMQQRVPGLAATVGLAKYDSFSARLEELALQFTVNALRQLGVLQPGHRGTIDQLARVGSIPSDRVPIFRNLLNLCAEAGVCSRSNEIYFFHAIPEPFDCLSEAQALEAEYPFAKNEVVLVAHCGVALARVLTGEYDPQQLLFNAESSELIAKAYKDSLPAQFFNQLLSEAVEALVARQDGRPTRILEIGAGTGATTAYLLPRLRNYAVEYVFTDISPFFVKRARALLQDEYPGVDYRTLDIASSAIDQNLRQSFDLVIAANVLHATPELKATLRNVREYMKQDANLLLLEIVGRQRWADITLGLSGDWLHSQDTDLRPEYGILPAATWAPLLESNGFAEVQTLPAAGSGPTILGRQELVWARLAEPVTSSAVERTCLILAGEEAAGKLLDRELSAEGVRTVLVSISEFSPRSASLPSALTDVIYFSGPEDKMELGHATEAVEPGCHKLLDLVRRLSSQALAPRVSILTRNAFQVTTNDAAIQLAHAPLSGVASTIAREHPEFRCRQIEVDGEILAEHLGPVINELLGDNTESPVAFRAGTRYRARLQHQPLTATTTPVTQENAVTLQLGREGGLQNMSFVPATRRDLGANEVEIRVQATALNFRDVMNATGLRQDPEPMGSECAGIVARVGEAVTSVAVGNPVFAICPGTFGTYALASAELTFAKPPELPFEIAAALPVAYLTADFCLTEVAAIQAGERVLIHAAAGGVGLAAVHLCLAAGAEVFATAGSEKKREHLRSLGVQHVYHSRTTTFAEAIRELTRETSRGEGVDVVLNSLTGAVLDASLSLVRPGGRFVEIGKADIREAREVAAQHPGLTYTSVDLTVELRDRPLAVQTRLRLIFDRITSGKLPTLPVQTFAWADCAEAFRTMATAKHIGKVVVGGGAGSKRGIVMDPEAGYLVTGGLSGLGLRVAAWLAESGARNLVLLGRRGMTAEAAEPVRAMRDSGATVHVVAGDVANPDDLRASLRSLGERPLKGVFHCAGVLANALIDSPGEGSSDAQPTENLRKVLRPKMDGAWNLHELSLASPLDYFVLFSSWASLAGSKGQANHCAANSFLDALAHYRRAHGLPGISINWGAWSEAGSAATADIQARFQNIGVQPLSPREGLAALEELLAGGYDAQMGVMPIDWPVFLHQFQAGGLPSLYAPFKSEAQANKVQPAAASGPKLRERLAQVPLARRKRTLTAALQELAAGVLGMRSGSEIDASLPLADLGMDSLLAVELRNSLSMELEVSFPATMLFDYPTITALADWLHATVFSETKGGTGDFAERTEAPEDDVLSLIENLSEDEADALLSSKGVRV